MKKAEKHLLAAAYLQSCMAHCGERISDWEQVASGDLSKDESQKDLQRDASPRCGLKIPEDWPEDVKRRGWPMWLFAGNSASVFGPCDKNDCPLTTWFMKTAPRKEIRELAAESFTNEKKTSYKKSISK